MAEQPQKTTQDVFKEKKEAIVKRKEAYYDKLIDSLKLNKYILDAIIIGLILVIIIIFVTQSK